MPLNTICYSSCDNCLPCLHLTGVIARKITLQVYNPLKNGLAGLISVDSVQQYPVNFSYNQVMDQL